MKMKRRVRAKLLLHFEHREVVSFCTFVVCSLTFPLFRLSVTRPRSIFRDYHDETPDYAVLD
jgi:hypothetical protein